MNKTWSTYGVTANDDKPLSIEIGDDHGSHTHQMSREDARRFAGALLALAGPEAPVYVLVKHDTDPDRDGDNPWLECPSCGNDDIREYDSAIRWNEIHVESDGYDVSQADAEFHTDGLICADCQTVLDFEDSDQWKLFTWN